MTWGKVMDWMDVVRPRRGGEARSAASVAGSAHQEPNLRHGLEGAEVYLDMASVMFVALDPEGKVTLVNRKACRILGYDQSEILGRDWFDTFVPPPERDRVKADFKELMSGHLEHMGYFENLVLTKDGRTRLIAWHNAILRDDAGQATSTLSSGEDVTERKRVEESLQISLTKYKTLFETLPLGITISDKAGNIIESNREAERLLGLTQEEHAKRRIDGQEWCIIRPDGSPMLADEYASVRALNENRLIENVEMGIVKGDGDVTWINVTAAPIPLKDYGVAIAYSDITERKSTEEVLRKSAQLLMDTGEMAKVGGWEVDLSTQEVSWTEEVGLIHGVEPGYRPTVEEALNFYAPESRPAVEAAVKKAAETGESYDLESLLIPLGSKDKIWVRSLGRAVYSGGKIVKLAGTFQNIDKYKRAAEALLQAQQDLIEEHRREKEFVETELAKAREELVRTTRLAAIGQVSASIAHDLRNPLGAVRNASYLLKRHLPQEAHLIDLVRIIDQEVTRADQIITRLLTMARAEPPHKQRVDLGQVIQEVFDKTEGVGEVRPVLALKPDQFWVHADPVGLTQVVSNLLTNAVQAMAGKGTFSVEAAHDAGHDTLLFRDTGPGISPEVRGTLFDPLVTTKAKGTGLGLTICRQIVERHGGTMKAENAPQGGAAITVRLPQA